MMNSMRLEGIERVTFARRAYVPQKRMLHVVNDVGGFMLVLPSLSGHLRLERGREVLHDGPVSPGMIRVVRPGERSALRADDGFASVVLQVPDETMAAALAASAPARDADSLRPVVESTPEVGRLVSAFDHVESLDAVARPRFVQGLTTALLTMLMPQVRPRGADRDLALDDEEWALALDFAEASLAGGIDVRTWSAVLGLAPKTFAARFGARAGRPPYAWFLDRRIERATALLRQGHRLADVALGLGFTSQSHFTDAFRSRVGISPAAWIKRLPL